MVRVLPLRLGPGLLTAHRLVQAVYIREAIYQGHRREVLAPVVNPPLRIRAIPAIIRSTRDLLAIRDIMVDPALVVP